MDLSKRLGLGTLVLIRPLSLIVFINALTSRVYKKCSGDVEVFLVLYVDNILLIGNDVGILSSVNVWLSGQFDMKDLGEVSHILGIKLLRDRRHMMLGLSQAIYIDKILFRFSIHDRC